MKNNNQPLIQSFIKRTRAGHKHSQNQTTPLATASVLGCSQRSGPAAERIENVKALRVWVTEMLLVGQAEKESWLSMQNWAPEKPFISRVIILLLQITLNRRYFLTLKTCPKYTLRRVEGSARVTTLE